MIQINNGYKDFYYLDGEKIYNAKSKKYLKPDKRGCYYLVKENGKAHHTSINSILKLVCGLSYAIDNIKDLPGEEWKEIKPGCLYSCSNYGRIKSNVFRQSRLLTPDTTTGYARIKIDIGDGTKNYLIHKLVCLLFLDKPKEAFMEVHHISGNRLDNYYKNLCYLTHEEHCKIHQQMRKEKESN